jgi:hypothetical protein
MGEAVDPIPDLTRQLAVLNERVNDARTHGAVREERLQKECTDLESHIKLLSAHIQSLDRFIKKLALVHSQLVAAPNYKLAKADVDEMVRLVSEL